MTVDLRVLGQVEVLVGGRLVELGHARQRCVLAALLVDANQVVLTERMVDRIWGECPPRRARQLVSNYLSRLRHLLSDACGGEAVIRRRGGGYVLLVGPDRVDVHRFRELVTRSRATTDQTLALELMERAAAQWRGEALAGLDTPWTAAVREGLARERFAADTHRIDLALRLGRHAASLPELTGRAAAHPLDEHVAAQLMLALYRSGRQADALGHYRRLRTRLADELGTDVGPDLRRLHQRILTTDPTLGGTLATDTDRSPTPRQLPAAPVPFTGRVAELAELDHALTIATRNGDGSGTPPHASGSAVIGSVTISAIGGVGGIGKTWLALNWAHRHLDQFPDGQLFVDLRGSSPAAVPTDPADALRGFLTALGADPRGLPSEVDALAARYRGLVAGRRMLVMLDDAASAEQVVPLLPGAASCTVLVTGRRTLSSLIDRHGARHLPLDVLSHADARALLAARLGEQRVAAEPDVTDDLVELCGRHPLALAVTARLAASRPARPLAELSAVRATADMPRGRHAEMLTAGVRVPRQLPAGPRLFTGRSQELAGLTAGLDEQPEPDATMSISVIDGTGGVGKTWLALHWAHQHLDRFPDGQLYVNLRGFDPSGEPVPSEVAMRGFLDALGVEPAAVPMDPGAQLGLYRSLLAGRRMLVLLDNARDSAQVTPLLPGSPTCAVLVTSRHRLDGLTTAHGARSLELGTLADAEARHLLARHIDRDRITAEPAAVTELLAYCAGLPLAISIVAARAGRHPRFPLAALAGELRDHDHRLDALETGDTLASLRAVLSWSHRAMSPAATAAFGLLGLAPGVDISLPAAANLLALSIDDAGLVLRELEHGNLVRQHTPGRYRMHDLVRLYAADRARHDHPAAGRTEAVRRVVDFYVHTAFAGDRLLQPLLPPITVGEPAAGCHPCALRDQTAALAWFATEQSNLLAAQHLAAAQGWAASVHHLAWILTTFLYREGRFHAALAVWQAGHTAIRDLNDAAGEAAAHQLLGAIFTELGRPAAALRHLARAEEVDDPPGQAYTHHTLGWFWSLQGDPRRALEHAGQARRLYRALDMPAGETRQLTVTSWYHAQLGDYEKARTLCDAALDTARRHRYREDEALALGIFGYIAHHTGHHTEAVDWYRRSRTLLHDIGSTFFEAVALDHLGQAHAALGELEAAGGAWERALELYRVQHRAAAADRVQRQLAALKSQPRPSPLDASPSPTVT